MMTPLEEKLVAAGFTAAAEWDEDDGEFIYKVPGEHDFRVFVRTRDYEGTPAAQPEVKVALPHQCEQWEVAVTGGDVGVDAAAALAESSAFAHEARLAHFALVDALRFIKDSAGAPPAADEGNAHAR